MDDTFMHKLQANLELSTNFSVSVDCCQYDDLNLKFNIFKDSQSVDLSNYTVEMNVLKPDKTVYIQNSMATTNNNEVNIVCTNKLTVVGGKAIGEVVFINKTTQRKKYSFNIEFYIKKSAIADGINSESSITLLDQMQQALDELRDITVNLTEAIQVNSEMKTNISTGTNLNDKIAANINIADNLNETLIANTGIANTINNTVVENASEAKKINSVLESNNSEGKKINVDLQNNITEGTKLSNALNATNNDLIINIEEGKQTVKDLTNANKDYSKHINNMNIHLTEDEKEQLLLLFQNFITLQNKVDRLIGDGFLSDEDGNIYVDENGDTYIT